MCTSQDAVSQVTHTSVPQMQLSLQRTEIVPESLGNDNRYGYLQRWIYEVGVTSTENGGNAVLKQSDIVHSEAARLQEEASASAP